MIKQILDFIFRVPEPNIQNYQVPVLAKKAKVEVKSTGNKTDEFGFAGEWVDQTRYEATNTTIKKVTLEGLDKYDMAYLKEVGLNIETPEGQGKAQTIKRLWSAGHSADQIEKTMKGQRGYSARSIDPYIAAYFAADSRRFEETGKRLREAVGEPQSQTRAKRSANKRK